MTFRSSNSIGHCAVSMAGLTHVPRWPVEPPTGWTGEWTSGHSTIALAARYRNSHQFPAWLFPGIVSLCFPEGDQCRDPPLSCQERQGLWPLPGISLIGGWFFGPGRVRYLLPWRPRGQRQFRFDEKGGKVRDISAGTTLRATRSSASGVPASTATHQRPATERVRPEHTYGFGMRAGNDLRFTSHADVLSASKLCVGRDRTQVTRTPQ